MESHRPTTPLGYRQEVFLMFRWVFYNELYFLLPIRVLYAIIMAQMHTLWYIPSVPKLASPNLSRNILVFIFSNIVQVSKDNASDGTKIKGRPCNKGTISSFKTTSTYHQPHIIFCHIQSTIIRIMQLQKPAEFNNYITLQFLFLFSY